MFAKQNCNSDKFKYLMFKSRHRRCSMKKCALRNFAKFIGKHLCQSLF